MDGSMDGWIDGGMDDDNDDDDDIDDDDDDARCIKGDGEVDVCMHVVMDGSMVDGSMGRRNINDGCMYAWMDIV